MNIPKTKVERHMKLVKATYKEKNWYQNIYSFIEKSSQAQFLHNEKSDMSREDGMLSNLCYAVIQPMKRIYHVFVCSKICLGILALSVNSTPIST